MCVSHSNRDKKRARGRGATYVDRGWEIDGGGCIVTTEVNKFNSFNYFIVHYKRMPSISIHTHKNTIINETQKLNLLKCS